MQKVNHIGTLITPEFLQALKEIYPLRSPRIQDSDRQIWINVGEQGVVEFLQAKYEEANQNILHNPLLPNVSNI